jgi:hypothetical protein
MRHFATQLAPARKRSAIAETANHSTMARNCVSATSVSAVMHRFS